MRTIYYYPELVQITGSINAALMMAQLEFWFKVTGSKPFYKFLEPCGHELYKEGDSWAEELGMTGSEVRTAFKRIGTIYKSKRAFTESQDIFKGKPYASYYDRIRKTTYYLKNAEQVKQMMPKDALAGTCYEMANTCEAGDTYKKTNNRMALSDLAIKVVTNQPENIYVTQISEDGADGDGSGNQQVIDQDRDGSVTHKSEVGLYREDYIDNNIQDKQIKQHKESHSLIPYTEIVKLYNDHLGELLGYVASLTQQEKDNIQVLWLKLNIKLEDFKKGFMKVSASRFLCGKVEGKKWRASLKWLITNQHLSKVLAGQYDDFVTRTVNMSKCTGLDKIKQFNQMENHNWDFDEIERLERLYIDRKLGDL